jgi:hypothetical protein
LSAPPFASLLDAAQRLEHARIEFALGGSGLLLALGLVDEARDWDLTTDAPLDRVLDSLDGIEQTLVGSSGVHADHKLVLHGGTIEIIVGFAIRSDRGVARLPTIVSGRWRGIPLGSPEVWAVAYALLGRAEKSELVLGHLERAGVDDAARSRLIEEPLPDLLRVRLEALPARSI